MTFINVVAPLGGVIVRQVPVGPMANFSYLLVDEGSREGLVVDSGWETDPILKEAEGAKAKVTHVVATHEHFDHTATLRELAGALGARVGAHESSPLDCDERLKDGQVLKLGRSRVRVLHTPGHTEDSICLFDGSDVFTGDLLFVGTIGRFESEKAPLMFDSLNRVVLGLPGGTMMYPGHDYGDVKRRTLAEERGSNPYLAARDVRSFSSLFS